MKRRPLVALLGAAGVFMAGLAAAEPVTYSLDPVHTRVHWETRHFGTSTQRGRFDRVEGSVRLDRSAGRGDVSISIDTGSVSSGVPVLDRVLRGQDFLASDAHPQAYFVASQWRFDGERLREVRGEFSWRGVSQPLSLHALRFACRTDAALQREVCGGDFEAVLLRSDFGSTFGLPFVGDTVRLLIAVEGVRQ
ncbi:YceI family protein [Piscinibacter sp.]|jgi:polyisoprenoid-binding protein YceI|uniref:YceI family protein n=1 Tax=Piscinibacter sp. TaxID=1903157 RepID=UPI002F423865